MVISWLQFSHRKGIRAAFDLELAATHNDPVLFSFSIFLISSLEFLQVALDQLIEVSF